MVDTVCGGGMLWGKRSRAGKGRDRIDEVKGDYEGKMGSLGQDSFSLRSRTEWKDSLLRRSSFF